MDVTEGNGTASGDPGSRYYARSEKENETAHGEFRVGVVLSKSFSVYFRNIVPFVILALIVTSPPHICKVYMSMKGWLAVPPDLSTLFELVVALMMMGIEALGLILMWVLTAAITYGAYQDLRGQRASIGECIARGLPMIIPVIGVSFIYMLLTILGLIALVVPGIIVSVIYAVAVPVAVVERPGVFMSLVRSAALTSGNRWRVFGVGLVIFGIWGVVGVINGLVMSAVGVDIFEAGPYSASIPVGLMSYFLEAFIIALGAVFTVVIYHELRMAKEGVGVDEIAAVFD